MNLRLITAALLLATPNLTAQQQNIVETAAAAGSFDTLLKACKTAGLAETLAGKGPFTVFAPTDQAFADLPGHTLSNLLKQKNRRQLTDILKYHVVSGRVLAKDALGLDSATTVLGQRIDVEFSTKGLRIDGAAVVTTDILCTNGVIHVIDKVLMPGTDPIPVVASKAKKFSTLLAAVKAAGLARTLTDDGPFTVFAPTDDAFAALPAGALDSLLKKENRAQLQDILKLHVVKGRVYAREALLAGSCTTLQGQQVDIALAGDGVTIDAARLVSADIEASNGVIHVIDRVLLPQKLSAADVVDKLEQAVSRGADLFNGGHVAQCLQVYRQAIDEVLDNAGSDVDPFVVRLFELSQRRAEREHDERERAWILRDGIDLAWLALRETAAATGSH